MIAHEAHPESRTPVGTWTLAALAGAFGLAARHGFDAPPLEPGAIRVSMLLAAGLFAFSRLLMIVPRAALRDRLRRFWLDYLLLAGGAGWWIIHRESEPAILDVVAAYAIATGILAVLRAGLYALTSCGHDAVDEVGFRPVEDVPGATLRPLFLAALLTTLAAAAVLTLPVAWAGVHPVELDETWDGQLAFEWSRHALNCLFTATAALSGTGLALFDLGHDLTRTGQVVVLGLILLGSLATLSIGTVIGWRMRYLLGWGAEDDDLSRAGLRHSVLVVCLIALSVQIIGTAALYVSGHAASDDPLADRPDPLFAALFHAVSAFANAGLTLTPNSMIDHRTHLGTLGVLMPLMLLGTLGGPVLHELARRIRRAVRFSRCGSRVEGQAPGTNAAAQTREPSSRGEITSPHGTGPGVFSWSKHTRMTLAATVLLTLGGAGLLFLIESTPEEQLRYPRESGPGHLTPSDARSPATERVPSPEESPRAHAQRMRTLDRTQRAWAALFHAVSARTGGMAVVRLDEGADARGARWADESISPASRLVLMMGMMIGGGIGGTAGGVRIILCVLLATAVFKRFGRDREAWKVRDELVLSRLREIRRDELRSQAQPDMDAPKAASQTSGPGAHAAGPDPVADTPREPQGTGSEPVPTPARTEAARLRLTAAAGAVAASMLTITVLATLVLVYRQSASFEACVFEAVSATCNVGLSTGLAGHLPLEDYTPGPLVLRFAGRIALILAMLCGWVLPLAVLLRCVREPALSPPPTASHKHPHAEKKTGA